MVDLLIRDVDERVVAGLKRIARAQGKSLDDVVREALAAYVKPSKAERVRELDRIRAMSPSSDADSTALIREDRDNDEPYR